MKQYLLFVLVGIFLIGKAFPEEKKLLFVQIVSRHGDRTPIKLYPNDPNPASFWPEGFKALTTLGKKQQFALGKYFRSRYENFATYNPLEVNVISSEVDRCLMSASSNMASFFAPTPEFSIDSNLKWQPIPIHYLPETQDKFLSASSYCPRAEEEINKAINSSESQRILKEHEGMFKNLSALSGFTIDDWTMSFIFHDVIMIEKKYNLTVPTWVEPYWNELTSVSDASFFWNYNSPLIHRLRAGPLVQKIIETMNQKINGMIPKLKFQVYYAHETLLAVLLTAINQYNMIQPPYCASLLIELFEMPDGAKTVRFLYQNSSKPEEKFDPPFLFILEGCTEYCPLDYFINYTRHLIPEDWDLECQLEKSFWEKIQENGSTILLTLIIVVSYVYFLWKMHSHRREKYAYHPID